MSDFPGGNVTDMYGSTCVTRGWVGVKFPGKKALRKHLNGPKDNSCAWKSMHTRMFVHSWVMLLHMYRNIPIIITPPSNTSTPPNFSALLPSPIILLMTMTLSTPAKGDQTVWDDNPVPCSQVSAVHHV